jgi:hypothetical protein
MTLGTDKAVVHFDEMYWMDDNAAQSVLLIDGATEAITESLYQVRSGSMLDDRDLAAAGVALGDLFGGLGQLADLLITLVGKYAETDSLRVERLRDPLETLRTMMLSAQQAAKDLTPKGS